MRNPVLYATSIICGFCMMALEIVGARALFPPFGSSVDTWAAIISVFILSLSVGYVIGGRIADRMKTSQPLGWIILLAGVFYCLLPVYCLHFTESLSYDIKASRGGVLLGALVLFLPPSLLLGCVSPILVRLAFNGAERVGRTTGTLYAVGSIGNVVGILVANYLLLAYVTLNANLWAMGVVLCLLGLAHLFVKMEAESPANAAAPATPAGAQP